MVYVFFLTKECTSQELGVVQVVLDCKDSSIGVQNLNYSAKIGRIDGPVDLLLVFKPKLVITPIGYEEPSD